MPVTLPGYSRSTAWFCRSCNCSVVSGVPTSRRWNMPRPSKAAGVRSPDALADEFAGLPAEVVPLDVTDLAAVGAAADACPDVNVLVNNAGLFTNTRLVRTDDAAAARREMEVNYFGVLNMTRAF